MNNIFFIRNLVRNLLEIVIIFRARNIQTVRHAIVGIIVKNWISVSIDRNGFFLVKYILLRIIIHFLKLIVLFGGVIFWDHSVIFKWLNLRSFQTSSPNCWFLLFSQASSYAFF